MLTLNAVHREACSLARGTHRQPSLKLALWAGILSCNNSLSWESRQLEVLRPYAAARPLPDNAQDVLAIVKAGHPYCSLAHAAHVLEASKRVDNGSLACLLARPTSSRLEDWRAWRDTAFAATRGLGLGNKTLSFAAMLLWPTRSQLVPVDRHVCARLGYAPVDYGKHMSSKRLYLAAEDDVYQEWCEAGAPYTLGEWHWYKWEEWRQSTGAAPACDVPQSHQALNCYVW